MTIAQRIEIFTQLGKRILHELSNDSNFSHIVNNAYRHNPWFTPQNCRYAIEAIANEWLTKNSLSNWVSRYPNEFFSLKQTKTIAVVMAGNVPFVGFHDLLCTLMVGHRFMGKVSSKDGGLMQGIIDMLIEIEPQLKNYITLTNDRIAQFDAVIATGSDNSARYFEHYFGKYPNIIRKNRHSLAVLSGNESDNELQALANDVFMHFGLGCRNVSKLLVPAGYDFERLIDAFKAYSNVINHNKYANNYEYHRAIYLMNRIEHLDTGFMLLKPDENLGSPVGVLFFQNYNGFESVNSYITANADNLQCVVSSEKAITNSIGFGKAQNPDINDYSDGIDTIKFLAEV